MCLKTVFLRDALIHKYCHNRQCHYKSLLIYTYTEIPTVNIYRSHIRKLRNNAMSYMIITLQVTEKKGRSEKNFLFIHSHGFHAGSMRQMFSRSAAALINVVTFDSPPSNSARSE